MSANNSYYLYLGKWQRMFSPFCFGADAHASILSIYAIGYINGYWVNLVGGVQKFY